MHRIALLKLIEEYKKKHPVEEDICDRSIEFIKNNINCFDRELEYGHITGSAWLLDLKGKRVLLTHHKKLNGWFQLGGHADGNCDICKVSLREAREESGINSIRQLSYEIFDIDIHMIPEHKGVKEHLHFDICFAFQVTDTEDYIVSDESHDLAWVDVNNISDYSQSKSMLRMASKWKNKYQF